MFLHQLEQGDIRVMTSASDLTAASDCEFAFLRRVDERLGREVTVPPKDDPMLRRAAELGDDHEARVLSRYLNEFGQGNPGVPGGVVETRESDSRDAQTLRAAELETVTALQGGAEVVFQATFFDPVQRPAEGDVPAIGFVGFADFLRRTETGHYEVQDTKLARRAKVTALMQLAAYAEQLRRLGIPVAPEVSLILGDETTSRHHLSDIEPVFRARRERLHTILLDRVQQFGAGGERSSAAPIAWNAAGVVACGRCEVCDPEVQAHRDLLLVAGLRLTQRARLVAAGITTIDALAAAHPQTAGGSVSVEGIAQATLERLSLQALLQTQARDGAPPPIEVIDVAALAMIPKPSPGDLFFDFEGDPLFREPGDAGSARWGIDYLFGMVDTDRQFTALWAHDLDEERVALERFLEMVAERRAAYPDMHIYHYAPYERTHLLSIAARHGVCEAEVDQLLREHVLVDLYPIVRAALRVGSRSYSIKKLEPLYMGDEHRDADGVLDGAESVTEFAEASALRRSDSDDEQREAERRLAAIAAYNEYDCVSTLQLRDWLRGLATERGIAPHSSGLPDLAESTDPENGESRFRLSPVAARLSALAAELDDAQTAHAVALAASAVDYHEREQKSFWWEHYARLVNPIDDWAGTRDVMVIDAGLSPRSELWIDPTGRQTRARRTIVLRGELAPGSTLKVGDDAFAVYEYPPPFPVPGGAPGARGARKVRIVDRDDDTITIEELRDPGLPEWRELPVALTPGPPPSAGAQKIAIEEWGASLAASLEQGAPFVDPVFDLMRRQPPRFSDGEAMTVPVHRVRGVGEQSEPDVIAAVTESVRRLDRSALAVQGPPGTGKTYLASHVIRELVTRHGWQIGVVGQSHKVVENVLEGVVGAGLAAEQVAKVPQRGKPGVDAPTFTVLPYGGHDRFLRQHRAAGRGAVVGGTAWDFAHPARFPRRSLDLLVIDEAGQFSLAPTIAAGVSAQRLLLLGDPQQLPQVSQGSHPEPVDASALGHLLGEHDTIPEELGYFLADTRRLRSELAAVVSELSYEQRLRAHPSASLREVRGVGPAGLTWHPVAHRGNSTRSPEEAAIVVELAQRALRGQLVLHGDVADDGETPTVRPLTSDDIIIVAAYNAQVECVSEALGEAGLGGIRVGTVDKFQGQEAVIAIVSLAASSGEDVPRGLEFLLMRNRLNVAISRAQWSAHLVSSDRLGDSLPSSDVAVAALSGYLRLTELGARRE